MDKSKTIKTPFGSIAVGTATPSSGATVSIENLKKEFKEAAKSNIIPKIEEDDESKRSTQAVEQGYPTT